jgi:hypothetical protein
LKITVKPESKAHQGLHKILIEITTSSEKSFNTLGIMVKLPITYIDSDLVPFFWPPLEDEVKRYDERWQEDL